MSLRTLPTPNGDNKASSLPLVYSRWSHSFTSSHSYKYVCVYVCAYICEMKCIYLATFLKCSFSFGNFCLVNVRFLSLIHIAALEVSPIIIKLFLLRVGGRFKGSLTVGNRDPQFRYWTLCFREDYIYAIFFQRAFGLKL